MKPAKSALVLSFAALLALSPAISMAAPKAGKRAPRAVQLIEKAVQHESVKLTDEQKPQVQAIIEDAVAQAEALQADHKPAKGEKPADADRAALREKMNALAAATIGKINDLLSDTQKSEFKAALKEERQASKEEREEKKADKQAK